MQDRKTKPDAVKSQKGHIASQKPELTEEELDKVVGGKGKKSSGGTTTPAPK